MHWKSAKIHYSNMSKIFKDTRMTSGVSTINFEHILNYILLLILLNSNRWILAGPEERQFQKILFSATSRNMLCYWEGKICWAISFNVYSPNLSSLKDKLSWQHFKKISWTLILHCKHHFYQYSFEKFSSANKQ